MKSFRILGPAKLSGTVQISGAKNSALKLMAASILSDDTITLKNIPNIKDVRTMAAVLRVIGMKTEFKKRSVLEITAGNKLGHEAPYELVSQMRASIIVLGPLLARLGKARVAMPGGCNIGSRKIDLHIRGLKYLGAKIKVDRGFIEAKAKKLIGTEIILDYPSVGATENILMAAVLAEGKTVIENAAREPEITDLANFLNKIGAKIKGLGTARLEIEGVKCLKGCEYPVLPDRIETGTLMIAAAITKGNLRIENTSGEYLELVVSKMRSMGVNIREGDNFIEVDGDCELNAVDIVTLPYPGFPTDLQAQILALLSLAKGTSILTENVFDNRFMAVDELNRMGADIRTEGHHAVVNGVKSFSGVPVTARDLRGGAALVLAGIAAKGVTEVYDIEHIDRGYEQFEEKLRSVGAQITRVGGEEEALAL